MSAVVDYPSSQTGSIDFSWSLCNSDLPYCTAAGQTNQPFAGFPATMTASLASLPPEILGMIIDFLQKEDHALIVPLAQTYNRAIYNACRDCPGLNYRRSCAVGHRVICDHFKADFRQGTTKIVEASSKDLRIDTDFLRLDGTAWSTDKDGPIMGLLAAEMTARTGKDPGQLYASLTERYGSPVYQRIDAPATKDEKAKLGKLSPEQVTTKELAGEPIRQVLTNAPGNGAPIGGLKVATENGWFAARPSGTEDVYKIYAESFQGEDHLRQIQDEARQLVNAALKG